MWEVLMFVLRGFLTFAVTVIAAFFTAVAARASGLFHLATYDWSELWDAFPPSTHLRMSAMNDFAIAACAVAIASCVMQYKIRPTWFEKVVATLLWAGLVGWLSLA
jgi:hypothetical protein